MECQFILFCNFKLLSILECAHEKLINSEIQFLKALPFTEFGLITATCFDTLSFIKKYSQYNYASTRDPI